MSFQTPGGPAAKRRRIDEANATLRKPFRSPLIARSQGTPRPGSEQSQQPDHRSPAPAAELTTPRTPATPLPTRGSRPQPSPAAASPLPAISTDRPTRNAAQLKRGISTATTTTTTTTTTASPNSADSTPTPALAPTPSTPPADNNQQLRQRMQVAQRDMQSRLRSTQQRLDVVRQARRIEQSACAKRPGEAVDAELRDMTGTWKRASRLAAEELFGLIKERVDGMGGAKAWRESRRRQREFYGGFEEGREVGEGRGGEEDGEGDESGEEGEQEEQGGEDEDLDSDFTMPMMLASLNIDPEVLGYDPDEDKWRD